MVVMIVYVKVEIMLDKALCTEMLFEFFAWKSLNQAYMVEMVKVEIM